MNQFKPRNYRPPIFDASGLTRTVNGTGHTCRTAGAAASKGWAHKVLLVPRPPCIRQFGTYYLQSALVPEETLWHARFFSLRPPPPVLYSKE